MKDIIKTLIILVTFGAALRSEEKLTLVGQSEFWADSTMTRKIAKTLGGPASDEKAVRAQLAGVTDTFFKSAILFHLEEMRLGKFLDYPAAYYYGISFAESEKRRCRIIVAFTTTHTYTIHCFSPDGEEPPDPAKYLTLDGKPSVVTEAAFSFLEPRLRDAPLRMQEMLKRVMDAAGKKG